MADEFICDTPELRNFIAQVKQIVAEPGSVKQHLAAIQPHFSQIMADPNFLPEEFRRTSDATPRAPSPASSA